ncbi:hypothetical protein MAR_019456 [Mya arenaria]|uniref:Uncharacterized protein n=1 Tax=Mya arenaria TaxID=6604 RepID=A0ABY7E256_MYAAR|nr:uncharacterized protein LOC128235170 [Mya arenaria]WAR04087.1 hypothetical protein MAR_019456 [Mya arenaria]
MDISVYVILCCLVLVRDASGSCGALTIMKPTFVNRKVTLKLIPHNQWITDIVWKYTPGLDEARKYAVGELKMRFQQTVQDGSHYHTMHFYADKSRNNSQFHVQCSNLNDVTRSNTIKIHLHEIRQNCGNLVLLSSEIKYGTNVEIAYYPSDASVEENLLHNARTWLKGLGQPVYLQNNTFEEKKISDQLYTLNIHNFMEKEAGRYALQCGHTFANTTNQLDIHVTVHTQPLNFSLDKVQNSSPYFDSTTSETDLKGDYSTRPFKFSLELILIGIGAFAVLCIFVASARTLVQWLKGRSRTRDPGKTEVTSPAIDSSPSLDTNVYVDMSETSMHMNASHDLEDDHVEMKTRYDSMARKPITPIESTHGESSLIYADLDIDHLQQGCAGPIPVPRPTLGKVATVYEDIDFSNVNPLCRNA